jgi:Flp pilus assembly protein TadG
MFLSARSFMRCRRGTTAAIFAIAAIPLIGVVGLGTETGMWYSAKRQAQNAADSAAYAGALQLTSGSTNVVSQGKEFAAQNSFCNTGDTAYAGSRCVTPPTGTTQSVALNIGNYSAPIFTTGGSPSNAVQAVVSQIQPPLLSSLFLSGNVTVSVQAIALIKQVTNPCVLATGGKISFQGSPTISLPGCGMASNGTGSNAIDFTGNGGINVTGPISTSGGCAGAASLCKPVMAYSPPIVNPFAALDSAMSGLTIAQTCSGSTPVAYTAATPCKNAGMSSWPTTLPAGVYFFSGALTFKGNVTVTYSNVTFILLPGASLSFKGTSGLNITGQTTVPTTELPASLQHYANLLTDLAIYDPESGPVNMGGNSALTFSGAMDFPNATVDFQGNPATTSCAELVASSVSFVGNANFNNSGCPSTMVKPQSQIVQLVQ